MLLAYFIGQAIGATVEATVVASAAPHEAAASAVVVREAAVAVSAPPHQSIAVASAGAGAAVIVQAPSHEAVIGAAVVRLATLDAVAPSHEVAAVGLAGDSPVVLPGSFAWVVGRSDLSNRGAEVLMHPSELRHCSVVFATKMAPGDSVVAASAVVVGGDSSMVVGSVVVSSEPVLSRGETWPAGAIVGFQIQGGTDGVRYEVVVTATTQNGERLVGVCPVLVEDERGGVAS
jgi:hypothetical protein